MQLKLAFFALAAFVLVLAMIVNHVRSARIREQRIRRQFGKIPSPCFRRTRIPDYWVQLYKNDPRDTDVDDTTWNDLNLDDLYTRINLCECDIGEDYLYAVMHRPVTAEKQLLDRERLMQTLTDEEFRVKVQILLAKLGRRRGTDLPGLLFETSAFLLPAQWRFTASALALPLCALLCFFAIQLGLLGLLLAVAHNIWLFGKTKKQLGGRIETMSYLIAALQCAAKLKKLTQEKCPTYAALLQASAAPLRKSGISVANLVSSSDSDLAAVMRFFSMATLLPVIQYCRSVKALERNKKQLQMLYCLLGEMGVAVSVLSYRESLPFFVRPEFVAEQSVRTTGLVHPLIENAAPNDACMEQNWLLTGSNASGKSTFLKAVAVNCVLAQTLYTCTARAMALRFGAVISSMAVEDNVLAGESYFVAEVKSMRRIVATVDRGTVCYCFIDEILKGTNTAERLAASCAILQYLTVPHCLCCAATHDLELTAQLKDRYLNYHFSEEITPSGVVFDYRLKQGPCTTRNAIRLLSVYDFPAQIVAQAERAL